MGFLQKLHAVIDIGIKLLVNPFVTIPIIFDANQSLKKKFLNLNYSFIIPPRTKQIVKIPFSY